MWNLTTCRVCHTSIHFSATAVWLSPCMTQKLLCQNQCLLGCTLLDFWGATGLLRLPFSLVPPFPLASVGPFSHFSLLLPPHTVNVSIPKVLAQGSALPLDTYSKLPHPNLWLQGSLPNDDSFSFHLSAQSSMSSGLLDIPMAMAHKHLRLNTYKTSSSLFMVSLQLLL